MDILGWSVCFSFFLKCIFFRFNSCIYTLPPPLDHCCSVSCKFLICESWFSIISQPMNDYHMVYVDTKVVQPSLSLIWLMSVSSQIKLINLKISGSRSHQISASYGTIFYKNCPKIILLPAILFFHFVLHYYLVSNFCFITLKKPRRLS